MSWVNEAKRVKEDVKKSIDEIDGPSKAFFEFVFSGMFGPDMRFTIDDLVSKFIKSRFEDVSEAYENMQTVYGKFPNVREDAVNSIVKKYLPDAEIEPDHLTMEGASLDAWYVRVDGKEIMRIVLGLGNTYRDNNLYFTLSGRARNPKDELYSKAREIAYEIEDIAGIEKPQ